ncbi:MULTISPECIES: response regulator [Streptomyces]|uniref:response regulator n=1 Tax=Streptomyces lycopersici TaxID=2974589 RepID=UPI0035251B81
MGSLRRPPARTVMPPGRAPTEPGPDKAARAISTQPILGVRPGITVVGAAADGVECVELARRLRPRVVLADIRMPRLDGLEVVRQVTVPAWPIR